MLHWLWVFIIGLVIGIIAKWIMPGKDPGGFIVTAIIGIIGSFIGGFIAKWIFGAGVGGTASGAGVGGFWGLILGVIGAIILLWIYRLIFRPKPGI
ncbi:MAG TPA: GlsB/YeaQ/YmgE family stress response membrane protein [Oleiagrimonas sp.]|nr:GlsB/YeaQ/YmgE family stress response membrane protein [Oleiagrimonas sp.]